MDADNVAEAERRIAASPLALIRRVGVPTDPGFGIAKMFEASDQRQWHVTCDSCETAQVLDFDENVDWDEDEGRIVNARLMCAHCGGALDPRRGEWIARHPEREVVGFAVSRLMVPTVDLARLVEASQAPEPYRRAAFYRSDLGLPYSDASRGLTPAVVAAAITAGTIANGGVPLRMELTSTGPLLVTAGIDVSSVRGFHVRVSEHLDPLDTPRARKRALFIGWAATPEEVAMLLYRYRVNFACVDAAPEYWVAQTLANEFLGHVFPIRYTNQYAPAVVDPESCSISVNRTHLLDKMAGEFRAQLNLLPEDLPDDYIAHMTAERRVVIRDEFDRTTQRWERRGADDYFHAEAFDVAATDVARVCAFIDDRLSDQSHTVLLADVVDFQRSSVADYDGLESILRRMTAEGYDPISDSHGFYDEWVE